MESIKKMLLGIGLILFGIATTLLASYIELFFYFGLIAPLLGIYFVLAESFPKEHKAIRNLLKDVDKSNSNK